jgi:hypothetical protein
MLVADRRGEFRRNSGLVVLTSSFVEIDPLGACPSNPKLSRLVEGNSDMRRLVVTLACRM